MYSTSSRRFAVTARPAGNGGFFGEFTAPGMVPGIVQKDGLPQVYETEEAAELGASRVLHIILNQRQGLSMTAVGPKPMAPEVLSRLLKANDIPPTFFARLTQSEDVMKWLDGSLPVPHPVAVLIQLLDADRENIQRAFKITNKAIRETT